MSSNFANSSGTSQPVILRGISSMATKLVLLQLTKIYFDKFNIRIDIESVGGVEAVNRIQSNESFDLVLLGSDSIDRLISEGYLLENSRQDWVESQIAAAIPSGTIRPDFSTALAVKNTILACTSLSYSTGPSGLYLEKLFEHWGITDKVKSCLVVPPPGTPVVSLVASGKAFLGFQQLSELISIAGIDILGTLPSEIAYTTIFSSGVPCRLSNEKNRHKLVKDFLDFLTSKEVEAIKAANGMKGISSTL